MKASIDNIICHYKNIHTNCSPESRCRKDPQYQPSKIIITDSTAEELLVKALHSAVVYKQPEHFVNAMDTFHVESFNNVLNMFHDKRIALKEVEYKRRSMLAVCH